MPETGGASVTADLLALVEVGSGVAVKVGGMVDRRVAVGGGVEVGRRVGAGVALGGTKVIDAVTMGSVPHGSVSRATCFESQPICVAKRSAYHSPSALMPITSPRLVGVNRSSAVESREGSLRTLAVALVLTWQKICPMAAAVR